MTQRRPIKRGPSRGRWSTRDWAASVTFSAFWHLLVLAVFALTVHPFQLPDVNRAIDLTFLPPLTPPPTQTVDVQLRPRQEEPRPAPPAPRQPVAQPQIAKSQAAPPEPAPPKAVEPEPQPQLETVRPSQPQLAKPIEVERRSVQSPRLQTQQAIPQIPRAPPEPVTVARPNSVLPPPIEAPRAQAPGRSSPLNTTVAAPQLPQAAPAEAEAPATVAPQVLTNSSVVQAPVEIRPRDRAPIASGLNTQAATPQITTPSGGAPPAGGGAGAPAGGGQAGAARPGLGAFDGINAGGGLKGLRTDLGCENPDTYKLTPEERDACLRKFGQRARGAPQLGLNIPDDKKAAYDRYESCQVYKSQPVPGSNSSSGGTSIPGLGANPSLKECGPGDR